MRKFIMLLFCLSVTANIFCQQDVNSSSLKSRPAKGSMERSHQPGKDFPDYPPLQMTDISSKVDLPTMVDNSLLPFLRPVFSQEGSASCQQVSTIAYNFCYEINRMRNHPADTNINQYPSHFAWNFMNANGPDINFGVSYFHTFDILYDAGTPTASVFGLPSINDFYYWMNGYAGYYQAMHNRISGISSINVGTPDGLIILKHWLNDHLDGSEIGGVASFSCGLPYEGQLLPYGTPEAGKHVETEFYGDAVHALCIVGYNDSIRYDLNGDGNFTNNLDITGDGIADMQDWEIGGLKFINSYGVDWADSGFCYMLYRTLALKYREGGMWNNSVHVLHPDTIANPLLTIKATISHNKRGRIRLLAGIASDTAQYYPTHTMSFSNFNYQGGDNYMTGAISTGKTLELGLDITPLLSYVKNGEPYRIFLIIDEKDTGASGDGLLKNYSVISYLDDLPQEYISLDIPMAIVNDGRTLASVKIGREVEPIVIHPEGSIAISPDTINSIQYSATGGFPPYTWTLKHIYNETEGFSEYNPDLGIVLQPTNNTDGIATLPLPFTFPFCGQKYDTLYMHVNGYLLFDHQDMPYFYLLYDENYLRQVRAIAGYMNYQLGVHITGDYISYIPSPDSVIFNWRISDKLGYGRVAFSTTVFPDGRISYQYGTLEPVSSLLPVIGLSDGTSESTYYSRKSGTIPPEGAIISYIPASLPDGITMNEGGTLLIPAQENPFSDEIIIIARDLQRIFNQKNCLLTTGPEIKVSLKDTLSIIPPGSDLPLKIEIKNLGSETISGFSINATSTTLNAVITEDAISGIEILPGQSVEFNDRFILRISDTVSIPQLAGVVVTGTLDGFIFKTFKEFQVDLPVIEVTPPLVADGNNLIPEPGEDAPLIFRIFNYGRASAGQLKVKVTIEDPYAAINGSSTTTTPELKGLSVTTAGFRIKVNNSAPLGRRVQVNLDIYGNDELLLKKIFYITIGHIPIALIDLDRNHNSSVHISSAIEAISTSCDRFTQLDSEILNYNYAFLSLGWNPYDTHLCIPQDSMMIAFLDKGGNLYLEGGRFYKHDPVTMLRERMRVEGDSYAWYYPADTISGIEGTPVEGIQFDYLRDGIKGENLIALEPAVPWLIDKNTGLYFTVALDSGSYRTIASSVEFGGTYMFNSLERPEMIRRYLNFLGYNTNPLSANFKSDLTSVCKGAIVNFEPVCGGAPVNYHWIFDGGEPDTWEGPNPVIKYADEGSYTVSLTVSDGVSTNTFFLNDVIKVNNCTVVAESHLPKIRIYPNPASDFVRIETDEITGQGAFITIYDLSGRKILVESIPAGVKQIPISVGLINPGLYLITLTDNNQKGEAKLIIY